MYTVYCKRHQDLPFTKNKVMISLATETDFWLLPHDAEITGTTPNDAQYTVTESDSILNILKYLIVIHLINFGIIRRIKG